MCRVDSPSWVDDRAADDQDRLDISGWCAVKMRHVGGPLEMFSGAHQARRRGYADIRGVPQDDDVLLRARSVGGRFLDRIGADPYASASSWPSW
jgi:predicted Zn-dependent protease